MNKFDEVILKHIDKFEKVDEAGIPSVTQAIVQKGMQGASRIANNMASAQAQNTPPKPQGTPASVSSPGASPTTPQSPGQGVTPATTENTPPTPQTQATAGTAQTTATTGTPTTQATGQVTGQATKTPSGTPPANPQDMLKLAQTNPQEFNKIVATQMFTMHGQTPTQDQIDQYTKVLMTQQGK